MEYKYTIETVDPNIDIQLYYCGREQCKPEHSWGPAVKDHFKIHYIHEGKGIFQLNNRTYHLSKGQGFLIPPGTIAYYQADSETPWNYSWTAFNGINAEFYLKNAGLLKDNPIFTIKDEKLIESCFVQMFEAGAMKKGTDMAFQGSLYLFLSLLIENSDSQEEIRKAYNSKENYIQKALGFIKKNYSRDMKISEIAAYIGIDRKYLATIFKERLFKNPQQFLMDYRIEKAIELIINSELSIADIARSVGYKDPLLFSKLFKKNKGVSPKNYRDEFKKKST
jgi:AraC-like DNA-binding protein